MDRRPSSVYRLALLGLAIPTAVIWTAAFAELLPFGKAPLWWSVEQFAQLDRFQSVVRWTQSPADDSADGAQEVLRAGDTITAINGRPLRPGDWSRMFRSATEGGRVTLTVRRGEQTVEITREHRFSLLQMVLSALLLIGPAAVFVPILLVNPGWFGASPGGLWRCSFACSIAASLIAVNPSLYADWRDASRALLYLWLAAMAGIGPLSWWRLVLSWLGSVNLHRYTARLISGTAIGLGVLGAGLLLAEGFLAESIAGRPESLTAFAAGFGELVRIRVKDLVWVGLLLVGLTSRPAGVQATADSVAGATAQTS